MSDNTHKVIKVKPEYNNVVIGFNNSGAPLGYRNDVHLLYRDAKATGDETILQMFETVDDAAVLKAQEEAFKKKQEDKSKKSE